MTANNILFAGTKAVGKTTAIKIISDDKSVSEKKLTTETGESVTIHYGRLKLGENDELHLYESPNHEIFSSVTKQLAETGIGLVVLVDNSGSDPLNEMMYHLEPYKNLVDQGCFVIGVTRQKENPSPNISDFHRILKEKNFNVPVFSVDTHQKNDVAMILQALLFSLDSGAAD